jgi:hypothetical protein
VCKRRPVIDHKFSPWRKSLHIKQYLQNKQLHACLSAEFEDKKSVARRAAVGARLHLCGDDAGCDGQEDGGDASRGVNG